MTAGNSSDYYRFREARELSLARAAVNPKVADIHREMASRYAELIMLESVSCYVPVITAPRLCATAL
ncbi:hypothetical protein [Sphingomonas sp. PB4P5]|uniref:hypothetical protein n=1 Tax=Parasphingomonas puruogangriensis TaxID=3096155 RepID=UPI002FC7F1F4